jgi:hypothetical protein
VQDIAKHYKDVVEFNLKSGNSFHHHDSLDFWRAVENQTKLVLEETKETLAAIEEGNAVELADGLADIFVTYAWLAELVYQAGFETDLAMRLVNQNNATKIFTTYTKAKETLEALEAKGEIEGLHIEEAVVKGVPYFTVRDGNRKIRKPIDFVSVDLTEALPRE